MLDPNHAVNEINSILNTREYTIYHQDTRSWFDIWWEKAQQWIADQLAKLFPALEPKKDISVTVLIALFVVVIVILGITAFVIFRSAKRKRILHEQKPLQSIKEIHWSFQLHLMEARNHESQGSYSLATRHLFLALLLYNHDRGWLEARMWKTNWEYYDELRKVNPQAAGQFYHLASFFEEVTYGERKVEKDEYIQFQMNVMKWFKETGAPEERGLTSL